MKTKYFIYIYLLVSFVGYGQLTLPGGSGDGDNKTRYYKDADRDGYGDNNFMNSTLTPTVGYVTNDDDCDDTNPNINIDRTWYRDADGDGYGNPNSTTVNCAQPSGYVSNSSDYNDSNALITNIAPRNFYRDADGDGYGDPNNKKYQSQQPSGYVTNASDCNDSSASQNIVKTWYSDADGDGYGYDYPGSIHIMEVPRQSCSQPSGYVLNKLDCNDQNAAIHPNTIWYRDADKDGYGTTSDTKTGCYNFLSGYVTRSGDCNDSNATLNPNTIWYRDADNDGYGNPAVKKTQCSRPSGYVSNDDDYNDSNNLITNIAPRTFYRDADNDTYGNPVNSTYRSIQPIGYVTNNADCNDSSASINPNTIWYKDADGDSYGNPFVTKKQCIQPAGYVLNDDDLDDGNQYITTIAPRYFYRDLDGDSYGNPANSTYRSFQPSGYVTNSSDCNDNDATLNPTTIWYRDADGDGWGNAAITKNQCIQPSGYVRNNLDYDDNNLLINNIPPRTFYADADSDTYGNPSNSTYRSIQPSGYVTNNQDCNDSDAAINPNTVWYADNDGDSWGNVSVTKIQCTQPAGYVRNDDDYDDTTNLITNIEPANFYADVDNDSYGDPNNTVFRSVIPEGYVSNNQDCNDNDPSVNPNKIWYVDLDGDGLGDENVVVHQCTAPVGYVDIVGDNCPEEAGNYNGCPDIPTVPSAGENYVYTRAFQIPVTNPDMQVANSDVIESIAYFDGLGRTKQSIAIRAGADRENIVAYQEYDEFGKSTKNYMPYAVDANGIEFRDNALEELQNFYNTAKYEFTQNPYSETITERSPANRMIEQAAPGNPWAYDNELVTYINPVYENFPSGYSFQKYWHITEIFTLNNNSLDLGEWVLGENFVHLTIEAGNLRLVVNTNQDINRNIVFETLPTGKLDYLDIHPMIKDIEIGTITDSAGNPTDYKVKIEDNWLTIVATNTNPALITETLDTDISYDLTQLQYIASHDGVTSANHTVKATYGLNQANEVRRFDVVMTNGDHTLPTLVANGYYPANELTKNTTKSENWTAAEGNNKTGEQFTDKDGRAILTRAYNNSIALDTYNVYDDFGNLTFVIPPKVTLNNGISTTELNELCYQYVYDHKNRLIKKKVPGKGWEEILYNTLDQVVLTKDARMAQNNEWLFTKYDALGRVTYTGIYTDSRERSLIQGDIDNISQYPLHEDRSVARILDGTTVYYTNTAFPVANMQLLSINYYDDYTFDHNATNPGTVYGQAVTANTKSLPTGSKVRILGTSDWTTSVSYYDAKARPIYAHSHNAYLNTTDVAETQLDFVGKVIESKTTHIKDSNTAIVTESTFTYDHMGRVLDQVQTINGQDAERIATNIYDEMGQLVGKNIGGQASNGTEVGLQQVDYTYNIRGWLKGINDVTNMGNDLFAFALNYDNPTQQLGAAPQYDGNISETLWKTANDQVLRAYGYTYDDLNRLLVANSSDSHYTVDGISYDENGNLLTLNRQGAIDPQATQFGPMDQLSYTYGAETNQLQQVTDAANLSHGFAKSTTTAGVYDYDVNGNMTADPNKGIAGISYNFMDLPTGLTVANDSHNGTISYIYDATGTKLRKIVAKTNAGTTVKDTTDYAGGYVYENGLLQFFNHAEGYIEPNGNGGYEYIYQYKDHLGNIRISYADKDGDGAIDVLRNNTDVDGDGDNVHEILAENNYYPFGLQHKGYNSTIIGRQDNYKYNGQENLQALGLNLTEMTYRQYDNALGRFMNPDPLAELAPDITPFRFGFNNPINYNDPLGLIENGYSSGDVVINWGDDDGSGGGFTWYNNNYNNGAGYVDVFNHDWAMQMFSPMDWERLGEEEGYRSSLGETYLGSITASNSSEKILARVDFIRRVIPKIYSTKWYDINYGGDGSGSFMDYAHKVAYETDKYNPIAILWDTFTYSKYGTDRRGNNMTPVQANLNAIAIVPVGRASSIGSAVVKSGSRMTKTLVQQADDLVKLNAGRNSVTLRTYNKQIRYDLAGKAHAGVPTPHKQVYNKNFVNGEVRSVTRASKEAIPMTQEEIRMIRKYLESLKRP